MEESVYDLHDGFLICSALDRRVEDVFYVE